MGKYVNGFNRFYARSVENLRYVTAGLTLFCRFHNDFQLPEHDPNSQEMHMVDESFKEEAIMNELTEMAKDKVGLLLIARYMVSPVRNRLHLFFQNSYRGANCSYGQFIQ